MKTGDCDLCHGTGCDPRNVFNDCPSCEGTGKKTEKRRPLVECVNWDEMRVTRKGAK